MAMRLEPPIAQVTESEEQAARDREAGLDQDLEAAQGPDSEQDESDSGGHGRHEHAMPAISAHHGDRAGRYRFDMGDAPASFRVQVRNLTNNYSWQVLGGGAFAPTFSRSLLASLAIDF